MAHPTDAESLRLLRTGKISWQKYRANLKPITKKQEKFVENYLKARGNATLAYKMTSPAVTELTARVNGCKMLKNEKVTDTIVKVLEDAGLPRDYFVMKMKDLAEAKDKDGHPDNRIQFDVMKMGMEFHGMIKKNEMPSTLTQVNYNVDADKLSGVLSKLSDVTKKLELSNIHKDVEDADIIETPSSSDKEDTGSQEPSGSSDEQGRLATPGDTEGA